jgi:DNA repair photolyase
MSYEETIMELIYEPKGPAREYSAWACNLYKGCGHKCEYCFGPHFAYQGEKEADKKRLFQQPTIRGPANLSEQERVKILLKKLDREAAMFAKTIAANPGAWTTDRVLMSFTSDPYQPLEDQYNLTKQALEIFGKHGVPATVLTKSSRAMRDIDIFVKYNVAFATTIIFMDESKRIAIEPNASPIKERLDTLAAMRAKGLPTWVSLEPIIDTNEAMAVIDALIGKTDKIKVGVIDCRWDMGDVHKKIEWAKFLADALVALYNRQSYYIKDGLWQYADQSIKDTWPREQ